MMFPRTFEGRPSAISSRSRNWLYAAMLALAITGMHLMWVDPDYLGFGNFFGNTWSIIVSVKHLLVAGMVGLGFWFNGIFALAR